MSKTACALIALSSALASLPATAGSLTGSAALTTNYVFRGISQTHDRPAVQAGAEYDADMGLYAGVWSSSINSADLGTTNATMELDTYGGYRGKITNDLSYDLGFLRYNYPGADAMTAATGGQRIDTNELYAAANWKWLNVKYSYSLNDYFGLENSGLNSHGSHYFEVNGNFDLPKKFSLNLHAGHLMVKNGSSIEAADGITGNTNPDYTDYRVTLNRDLGQNWAVSLSLSHTNGSANVYTITSGAKVVNLGKTHAILALTKNF